MRITKQQAINLHNEAVSIREKMKEIEAYLASLPDELTDSVKESIKSIYDSLNKQQAVVSYFLNGFPVKTSLIQEKIPEEWESAPIDELDVSDASIRLLKRHDIFSIDSLKSFLQNQSLSDLRGCGPAKAEQIEEALERYEFSKKQNKENEEEE